MSTKNCPYETLFNRLGCFAYEGTKQNEIWVPTFLGDSFSSLVGVSATSFLKGKRNWLDVIIEQDRKRVIEEAKILESGPGTITQEYRIQNAKGDILWVRDVKHSFFEKKKLLISGLIFNITSYKELESQNHHLLHELSEKNLGLEHALNALNVLNRQLENDLKSTKAILFMQLKKEIFPLLDFLPKGKYSIITDEIKLKLSRPFVMVPSLSGEALTKQESNVLVLIQSGLSHQDIATELKISVETVKSHVKNIKSKLGLKGKGHLYKSIKQQKLNY